MDFKDYVREGFFGLLPPLADFVADGMKLEYDSGWKYETAKILGKNSPRYDDDDEVFKRRLGVGACLEILRMEKNVFSGTLGENGEDMCADLAGVWDALVRVGQEDFDEEYAARALSVMSDFAEIAGPDCMEKIRTLREGMERKDADDGSTVTLGGADEKEEPPKYDRLEAAILLDACVKVTEGSMTRGEAVKDVSEKLRAMAENSRKEIAENFRNEDDVSSQLDIMETMYAGIPKKSPWVFGSGSTVIFFNTVRMYEEDRPMFEARLGDALEMCGISKGRTAPTPAEGWREPSPNIVRMPNFNIFEAAVLHDECVKVREHGKDRAEAVRTVSKKLRKRAKNLGMSVPENYRNVSGISSEMYVMDNAIRHTEYPGSKTPVVFKDIVELYSSARSEYDRILKVALESCE